MKYIQITSVSPSKSTNEKKKREEKKEVRDNLSVCILNLLLPGLLGISFLIVEI